MDTLILILILTVTGLGIGAFLRAGKWRKPKTGFPHKWRVILAQKVAFFNALSKEEQGHFEYKVQELSLIHI